MDAALAALVDFVAAADPAGLPHATVHEVVRHVVDTVGCGAGGFGSRPAQIVREVTAGSSGELTASVYGRAEPRLVDAAAFANGTANRYLDFNDFGASGHPSDMTAALIALAEANGASGLDLITAVYVAYEIATVLAEASPQTTGWDQGIYSSLGVAGGAAMLLGLTREQTAHALSLAIVPNLPLKVTRYGELSQWKAAAVPHAAMTALLAVRLARAGMTGPQSPFEGRSGLFEQAWESFELCLGGVFPSAIERSSLKRFGACYWGQVAIDISTRLREGLDVARIDSVHVATSQAAYRAIGGGADDHDQKWRPYTRETADHSMPFLVATALLDGGVRPESFDDLQRVDRMTLMQRIEVIERSDLTGRSTRDRCPTEVVVTLDDGEEHRLLEDFPRGHPANPMSDADVAAKFDHLVHEALPVAEARQLSELLWRLADLPDLASIGTLLRRFGAARI